MFEQGLPVRFQKPKGWLWGQFTGARGQPLRFGALRSHKTPVAHIVYVEGLSEYAEKTFELARDFNAMACNFSVFDRHGQGKSPRYIPGTDKQHSDGIAADIQDIIKYCRDHIPAGEKIVLLGHSTGALLALHALEKAPDLFSGAILTAPLFGFKNAAVRNKEEYYAQAPFPEFLRTRYIPGGSPYTARVNPRSPHKAWDFSSDPVRSHLHDYWPEMDKDLRTGSPTFGWIQEICRAIIAACDPAFLQRITQPVLVFSAGDDVHVPEEAVETIVKGLKNAGHHHYQDGKHELLLEKDAIRKPLLARVQDFLKRNL